MNAKPLIALAIASLTTLSAVAQDRLPTIPPAQYTPDQKQAAVDWL